MSEFMVELNNIVSPDPENNVFADIWKQYERVVLLGDWNINSFAEFGIFTDAGYTLANTDERMPTYNSGSSLDNIVYKGVNVTDFALAGTDLSDHYALYCTITVNKD